MGATEKWLQEAETEIMHAQDHAAPPATQESVGLEAGGKAPTEQAFKTLCPL